MLTIEEYVKLYPEDKSCLGYLSKYPTTIMSGMLKFNEDTAFLLCGAFKGDYGHFELNDNSNDPDLDTEEYLNKEELAWNEKQNIINQPLTWANTTCTIERPVEIYICGNDDTSYSKFFETVEAAKAELKNLISCEPLDLYKNITDNGFVFTN